MRKFFVSLLGILSVALFLTLVSSTLNYAQSTEHDWVPNDLVWVNHICTNVDVLKLTASEYQKGTEQGAKNADELWKFAVMQGLCVTSPENFLIRLIELIEHYPNLFGAEGYHGELWSAYTMDPAGNTIIIYAGVIAKEFASKQRPTSHNNI